MRSCVCSALMERAHYKFNLSTRHQRSPTSGRFPRLPQHWFSPSHLLFLPLKIRLQGCLCCSCFFRGSSCFLQLGTARQRRRGRRRSSDVPRGHTDDSEAHLGPWPPRPPEAEYELWGQTRRSGTSPLLSCPCWPEHSSSL